MMMNEFILFLILGIPFFLSEISKLSQKNPWLYPTIAYSVISTILIMVIVRSMKIELRFLVRTGLILLALLIYCLLYYI